jgi:hypothetical protein
LDYGGELLNNSNNPNQNSAVLWRIFSSNKSAPANRKEGFYTSRQPKNEEIGGILYLATQNFEFFSKIQDQIKKLKTYSD